MGGDSHSAQHFAPQALTDSQERGDELLPVGHGFLAVLQARVEGIQLVVSSCKQDLEQAAPLLHLPCIQLVHLIAKNAIALRSVGSCSTTMICWLMEHQGD